MLTQSPRFIFHVLHVVLYNSTNHGLQKLWGRGVTGSQDYHGAEDLRTAYLILRKGAESQLQLEAVSARSKARVCPTSTSDCVSCHMPKQRVMAHSVFTEHWIRVTSTRA